MKLQLDSTINFHRLMNIIDDDIMTEYKLLKSQAKEVHTSTFSKKEIAFSLIADCCALMGKLSNTGNFIESYIWIEKYGSFKTRFRQRAHQLFASFILDNYGNEVIDCDKREKNRILANRWAEHLRIFIPEIWDRFEYDVETPLQDRTKCPYAKQPPIETEGIFTLKTKRSCKSNEGCKLKNMLKGEAARASCLLESLKSTDDNDKTAEIKQIQLFLENFFEKGNENLCYSYCNKKIGDVIIALETLEDHTLVTTNYKETEVISPAINQDYKILRK